MLFYSDWCRDVRQSHSGSKIVVLHNVDDERLALEAVTDGFERLPRLQGDDARAGKGCLVDVGGAVVEVVGDEHRARMLGIADGVRRLTLPSFDRVEEYRHSAIVMG